MRTIESKEGLIWLNGDVVRTGLADEFAIKYGHQYAEQLVNQLEYDNLKLVELENVTLAVEENEDQVNVYVYPVTADGGMWKPGGYICGDNALNFNFREWRERQLSKEHKRPTKNKTTK